MSERQPIPAGPPGPPANEAVELLRDLVASVRTIRAVVLIYLWVGIIGAALYLSQGGSGL